jgi:hypothetical protein
MSAAWKKRGCDADAGDCKRLRADGYFASNVVEDADMVDEAEVERARERARYRALFESEPTAGDLGMSVGDYEVMRRITRTHDVFEAIAAFACIFVRYGVLDAACEHATLELERMLDSKRARLMPPPPAANRHAVDYARLCLGDESVSPAAFAASLDMPAWVWNLLRGYSSSAAFEPIEREREREVWPGPAMSAGIAEIRGLLVGPGAAAVDAVNRLARGVV